MLKKNKPVSVELQSVASVHICHESVTFIFFAFMVDKESMEGVFCIIFVVNNM